MRREPKAGRLARKALAMVIENPGNGSLPGAVDDRDVRIYMLEAENNLLLKWVKELQKIIGRM